MKSKKSIVVGLIWLGVVCLLTSCIAGKKTPSMDRLNAVRKITIVPMEPLPIEINPLASVTSAKLLEDATTVSSIPVESVSQGGRTAVLALGIPMLISLPDKAREKAQLAASLEEALSSEGVWLPVIVLARQTAEQLSTLGGYEASVINGFHNFPGLNDRERTWHLMNWRRALIDWFNADLTVFDYQPWSEQDIDTVMELSVDHVIGLDNRLLVEVYVKLVDTATGEVIGRARSAKTNPTKIMDLFEQEGMKFKGLYTDTGVKIIVELLEDLKLLATR
jgi:hypothetical protein